MTERDAVVATTPGSRLSPTAFLRHRRGRPRPLVREALTERLVREGARKAGLTVADADLQAAPNIFLFS